MPLLPSQPWSAIAEIPWWLGRRKPWSELGALSPCRMWTILDLSRRWGGGDNSQRRKPSRQQRTPMICNLWYTYLLALWCSVVPNLGISADTYSCHTPLQWQASEYWKKSQLRFPRGTRRPDTLGNIAVCKVIIHEIRELRHTPWKTRACVQSYIYQFHDFFCT